MGVIIRVKCECLFSLLYRLILSTYNTFGKDLRLTYAINHAKKLRYLHTDLPVGDSNDHLSDNEPMQGNTINDRIYYYKKRTILHN